MHRNLVNSPVYSLNHQHLNETVLYNFPPLCYFQRVFFSIITETARVDDILVIQALLGSVHRFGGFRKGRGEGGRCSE